MIASYSNILLETEVELALENRFPPQLSKMDLKKNLKTETIDAAIKIMQKVC